ncbi:MAG: hypothetical protein AB7E77_07695 [Desulfobulbus sp.]
MKKRKTVKKGVVHAPQETPLVYKRQEEPNALENAQNTPVVFSPKKSKKFTWINS